MLSQYFNRGEFACKCGCGYDTVDALTLEALEAIRNHFKSPVTITSACRCVSHNKAVGGASKSQHLQGRACDIQVKHVAPAEVQVYAESLGISVGSYNTFTHIDTRSNGPARWKG
jgi:uncharacterized protein YcbK (DUF882 family)